MLFLKFVIYSFKSTYLKLILLKVNLKILKEKQKIRIHIEIRKVYFTIYLIYISIQQRIQIFIIYIIKYLIEQITKNIDET